jgi:hypothetical protein
MADRIAGVANNEDVVWPARFGKTFALSHRLFKFEQSLSKEAVNDARRSEKSFHRLGV